MPKWKLRPAGDGGLEGAGEVEGQCRLGRWRQVGRTAQQPGHVGGDRVEHLARCVARGQALGVGLEDRQRGVPAVGQLAPLHLVDLRRQFGVLRAVGRKAGTPGLVRAGAALAEVRAEMFAHAIGHGEARVGVEAVELLGAARLVDTQRLAVGGGAVLLVRRAVADVAVHDDQRWAVVRALEGLQRQRRGLDVVGVGHLQHLPAAGREARADVLGKGDGRRAFDADVVAVVDPAQPAELQVAGERCRFGAQPFHHVAVAGQREHPVVEEREAGTVVGGGQPGLRDGHAHAGGHALAQRAGGGLDAGGPAVLRVPGAAAAGLAKALQVGHRHRQAFARPVQTGRGLDAAQMQQPVQQRRGVADRQHEAVAVGPSSIFGVERRKRCHRQ